jgi:hypothetical protein
MNGFGSCCFWLIAMTLSFVYLTALIAACIDGARRIALTHDRKNCCLCNCLKW